MNNRSPHRSSHCKPSSRKRWEPSATHYAMFSTPELIDKARKEEMSALMQALADRLEDLND